MGNISPVKTSVLPKTKKPAVIADLPDGVHVYHDDKGSIRVMLGKKFTGGKVIKKRFATRGAAKEFIFGEAAEKFKNRTPGIVDLKRDVGGTAFDVPRSVFSDASAAWAELKKVNAPEGILGAVRYYIKHSALTAEKWTVGEAAAALDKNLARKNRDAKYRKGLGWCYGRFEEDFPKTCIRDITKAEIEDWLDEEDFEQSTRNNYIRDLKILFNFAMKQNHLGINPMKNIDREEVASPPLVLLSIRDTARVLLASTRIPGIQTATAIKFFAGLRTSEVRKLEWGDIGEEWIIVQALKAKTRARRSVTISSNLRAWFPPETPESGFVAPQGNEWRPKFALLKSAVSDWPRNCQRHAFGSYHIAKHTNENLTALEMGNTPEMIHQHYRGEIKVKKMIEEFWSLTPANVAAFADPDDKFWETMDSLDDKVKKKARKSPSKPSS